MNYELIARKIVDKAVIYIKANPEQKFGAAQTALGAVGVISAQAFDDLDTNTANLSAWHSELLGKINEAALE